MLLILSSPCVLWSQPLPWRFLGPDTFPVFDGKGRCANGLGLVGAVYADPYHSDLLFAGSNTGGLFRSLDGGQHWENVTDDDLPLVTGIGSIVRDPLHPKRFYIGTGSSSFGREYGLGVWRSEDEGISWEPTGLRFHPEKRDGVRASVKKLLIHPADPAILYALVRDTRGASIYRTRDTARTWEQVLQVDGEFFFDAELDPGDPDVIYVGGRSFWVSMDGGEQWRADRMDAPRDELIYRVAVSVHPAHPGRIWALYETNGPRGIVLTRSSNHGRTWSEGLRHPFGTLSVGQWKMEFAVSPTDTSLFYAGGIYMHRSRDGGRTFRTVSEPNYPSARWMHVDVRSMMVFGRSGNDILVAGHDGGVSISYNGGDSWRDVSGKGLAITQFWRIAYDPARKRTYGGTQDLGLLMLQDGTWENMKIYGDVYDGLVYPPAPDTLVMLINSGAPGMRRSTDGGRNWKFVQQPFTLARNDRPLAMDRQDPERIFVGYQDIHVSGDFGETWSRLTRFAETQRIHTNDRLAAIAVAPSDGNIMYAAYGEPHWSDMPSGKLFRSKDRGQSWVDISSSFPGCRWAGLTDITVSPQDPDRIWASVDGFWEDGSGTRYKVFSSRDGGESWENISEGLPNLPVNKLLVLSRHQRLIAGTDAGVWSLSLRSGRWEPWDDGMPRTLVSDLETDPGESRLLASTFGRGLYSLDLPAVDQDKVRRGRDRKGWLRIFRKQEDPR